jgi:hypothetical protein
MIDWVDSDAVDIFYFIDVIRWDEEICISFSHCGDDTREEAINSFHHTIQS